MRQSRQIVSRFNKPRDRKCDYGLLVLDTSNLSNSCISTDVDGRYSDTEKTNTAVIEAYRMSHDFAVVCPEVEHCVFQVSLFTFFFSRLVFSEEDFTGEEEMPSFRGELSPPARSPPPTKHTHKHAADGVSVTFQNVK